MKTVQFCLFLLMFGLGVLAYTTPANATCINTTPCTCSNAGTPPGWCRECCKTDPDSPYGTHCMTVCGTNPNRDTIACNRAQQVCNGQQPTCTPDTMSSARANQVIGAIGSGGTAKECVVTVPADGTSSKVMDFIENK